MKQAETDSSARPADRPAQHPTVGLRDVARAAGVSTATVSRVMNTPERVSSRLRDRVEAATLKLGWVPDALARALSTRRSKAIGAVFPTLSHGDFARAIEALQDELTLRGYTLLLACSHYDLDQEHTLVHRFVERGVDGVVLVGNTHRPDTMMLLERHGVPFVNTFNHDAVTGATSIGPDNRGAMHLLTHHLMALGHRRFGMIAQSIRNNDRAAARLQGVRDALAEAGLSVRPQHFAEGEWGIGQARALFRTIIHSKPWPTAIICGNAYLAIGAVLEAMHQKIEVPGDISIVGYDDVELMQELPIPITTLRVRSDEVGRRAAIYLTGVIAGEPTNLDLECEVEVIVRSSSGPPPNIRSRSVKPLMKRGRLRVRTKPL